MEDEAEERWEQLCQQASLEQDPDKLFRLILEINNLLKEKRSRLENEGTNV
jgi:hypothetical protein